MRCHLCTTNIGGKRVLILVSLTLTPPSSTVGISGGLGTSSDRPNLPMTKSPAPSKLKSTALSRLVWKPPLRWGRKSTYLKHESVLHEGRRTVLSRLVWVPPEHQLVFHDTRTKSGPVTQSLRRGRGSINGLYR